MLTEYNMQLDVWTLESCCHMHVHKYFNVSHSLWYC